MIDLPLALVGAAHLGAVLSLFGALLFESAMAPFAAPLEASLDRLAGWSLAAALVAAVAWLLLEARAMAGLPLADITPVLGTVLLRTWFGTAFLAHLGGLAGAGMMLLLRHRAAGGRRLAAAVGAASAGAAVIALAAIGHGAAMGGWLGSAMTLAEVVHVLAAGAWLGSLLPLLLLLRKLGGTPPALAVTRRYSGLGLVCVAALALSGAANGWVLVGTPARLVGTPYGHWILVKTALFAAMIGLAALNRWRHTPALAGDAGGTVARRLRRSVAREIVLGAAVIVAAALLAASPPP